MVFDHDKQALAAAADLRRRAEAQLKAQAPEAETPRSDGETLRLLHELQVHQVELEMQNAELRQARDEQEQSLEEYTDLYDFAPVGYLTLDRDGTIRAVNLTGATLLGIERSRLVGRRFGQLVAVDARPAFTGFLHMVFSSTTKQACEVALLHEGKDSIFVQIDAVATAYGEECRAALIDVSGRRQLEAKLEILNTDLVAHTAELEAANIELEAFNHSISHDLRGPLTVIVGYCEVLEDIHGSTLNEKCREHLRTIHTGALQMNRLIDTLLNFSRVKHIELHHEQVDLSNLAKEVALRLKEIDPERRVTFRIAAGIVTDGDGDLLRVVLDNLIGNAWKFSVNTEAVVIAFGVTAVDGKPVYFIRDNGPGFAMADAQTIFMPFRRLPGTEVEGHGIGLATADRIVRRHGGKVWAESKPGEGATFYFTLA